MKPIIKILVIFLLFVQNAEAQIPDPGTYTTNNTFVPFHGTWQWISGTDTVKIFLNTKKVRIDDYDVDLLCGWHIYKRGNTIIESSYNFSNIVTTQTIDLWNDNTNNNPKVEGTLRDLSKGNKENRLYLTLNSSQNQLTWRCTEWGGHVYGGNQNVPQPGVTLPQNMILIKL